MADYLSYNHAINVIRLFYEDCGFELHDKTPGKSVTNEFGHPVQDCKFGALFAFLDEQIFILRYQNYYLSGCLFDTNNASCVTNLRFCTGMLSTLCSIRALAGMGLDLNARGQLRYFYELSLLWCRIMLDPVARQAFEQTNLEGSNDFWHKYIARRRCERFLFDGAAAGAFQWHGASAEDHIDDIYSKLSISGHPGLWGLYINASDDFRSFKDNIIGRGPEYATQFTLSSAILLTILPFGINDVTDWKYNSPNLFDPENIYPARPASPNWNDYAYHLRKMILGMALCSFRFSTELTGGKWE